MRIVKWPLDKERAAFDDAGLEKVASGAARGALNEQAFALAPSRFPTSPTRCRPPRKRRTMPARRSAACSLSRRRRRRGSTR